LQEVHVSAGRLVTMVVAAAGSIGVGGFALQHALAVRARAQAAAVAQARAADAVERASDAAAAGGAPEEPKEPPRPQGGFGDGLAPAPAGDQRDLRGHATLAPREARADASGERVAPFHGFGVSVDSVPAGARVVADGAELGETPLTASVACQPGAPVALRVEKKGFRPWSRETRCRGDALVVLEARLRR
jgi:hypothetical protein